MQPSEALAVLRTDTRLGPRACQQAGHQHIRCLSARCGFGRGIRPSGPAARCWASLGLGAGTPSLKCGPPSSSSTPRKPCTARERVSSTATAVEVLRMFDWSRVAEVSLATADRSVLPKKRRDAPTDRPIARLPFWPRVRLHAGMDEDARMGAFRRNSHPQMEEQSHRIGISGIPGLIHGIAFLHNVKAQN